MSEIQFKEDRNYVIFSTEDDLDNYISLFKQNKINFYKPTIIKSSPYLAHRLVKRTTPSSRKYIEDGYATFSNTENTYLSEHFDTAGFIFYRGGDFYLVNFPSDTTTKQKIKF